MTKRAVSLFVLVSLLLMLVPAGRLIGEELVIYPQGLACVREIRELRLEAGDGKVKLAGVPTELIPSSLYVEGGGEILSQAFHYTPAEGILNEYVGEEIEAVSQEEGKLYRGTLIAAGDEITIRDSTGGIHIIRNPVRITLSPLEELATDPYVELTIRCLEAGDANLSLLYLTRGIGWQASYMGFLNAEETAISLQGWISVANSCGRDLHQATVSLIAGELNQPSEFHEYMRGEVTTMAMSPPPLSESAAFEYHLYRLPGRLDLPTGESLLVPYTAVPSVAVEKSYKYDGARHAGVQVAFAWENRHEEGPGVALPAGAVRLFHRRETGTIFIGQDTIPHTPTGEEVTLKVGSSFDLVGERVQLAKERITSSIYQESYRITLRNRKNEPVRISVIEHPPGSSWRILSSSHEYEQVDAATIRFVIDVVAGEEQEIDYTVEYSY